MAGFKKTTIDHVKYLRDFVLDLVFPVECLGCAAPGEYLCHECFKSLSFNEEFYCPKCRQKNEFGEYCGRCRKNTFMNGIWIAGSYKQNLLALLIKNYKYRFNRDIGPYLGDYLVLFLKHLLNTHRFWPAILADTNEGICRQGPDTILDFSKSLAVPAPLHKKRLKWRGFSQTRILAEIIAKNFNIEIKTGSLIRKKDLKPQAKLKAGLRLLNQKNNFSWKGSEIEKRNIILIDDIATTGATLNECARALKEAGAAEIWGLVLAQG